MAITYAARTDITKGIRKEYKAKLDSMDLKEMLKEFFSYLDYTEESDSGRVFHPIEIGCCRCLMHEPLDEVITRLRDMANT